MGARGPKPGFKQAKEAGKAAHLAAMGAPTPIPAVEPTSPAPLVVATAVTVAPSPAPEPQASSAADLEFASWLTPAPKPIAVEGPPPVRPAIYYENPAHLEGDALRALGHRRGLALSAMASMTDEKIRQELKYIAYNAAREYSEA